MRLGAALTPSTGRERERVSDYLLEIDFAYIRPPQRRVFARAATLWESASAATFIFISRVCVCSRMNPAFVCGGRIVRWLYIHCAEIFRQTRGSSSLWVLIGVVRGAFEVLCLRGRGASLL